MREIEATNVDYTKGRTMMLGTRPPGHPGTILYHQDTASATLEIHILYCQYLDRSIAYLPLYMM